MIFNENYPFIDDIKCHYIFIYFLCAGDEVVYVGQTRVGLYRPFSHRDKEYNRVKILPCEETQLDYLEEYYIKKYKPKYNIMCNGRESQKSIIKVKNKHKKSKNIQKLPKIQNPS